MNLFKCIFVLLSPMFAFASPDNYYAQPFADSFREGRFNESLQLLERWEASQPSHRDRILGIKAAVYLAMGDLEKSRVLMEECVQNLGIENIADPVLRDIFLMYYKALESPEQNIPNSAIGLQFTSSQNRLVFPCKHEQPIGLKFKYWFGVGQILAGVLAAPFSAGTSLSLILSGTAIVADAAADALNNKENWERELDDRRRIDPDVQNNSFLNRLPHTAPNMQLYTNNLKIWFFERAKAPRIDDHKRPHIANIGSFTIVNPRELSRGSKTKSSGCLCII